MTREQFVDIAKRNLAHHRAGTVDQAPGVYEVPSKNYYDPERWAAEMDAIFKRVPLVVGFTAELRDENSYKSIEVGGTPVLLTRAADGAVRAFVNMCSHRGAILVEPGLGSARRFACPYHNWTYDTAGDLVGVYERDQFGEFDTSCKGLTPLAVAERAGIIWVNANPGASMDIDTFLQGYDELLELVGLVNCTYVGHNVVHGPNWKVAYDGYLDSYHLPILHKNSFGPEYPNKASYDSWGPHQLMSSPMGFAEPFENLPADEWPDQLLAGGVITIFPHISIAGFPVGDTLMYMVSQLFPGEDADSSYTIQNFLTASAPEGDTLTAVEEQMAFLEAVVRDEDYATGLGIQKSVKTGAKDVFMFGRNEAGGQLFHRWVDTMLATSDDDLAALFEAGVELPNA